MDVNLVGLAFALVALVAVVLADRQLRRYLEARAKARTEAEAGAAAALEEIQRQVDSAVKDIASVKSAMALKQSFGK